MATIENMQQYQQAIDELNQNISDFNRQKLADALQLLAHKDESKI